MRGRLPRSNCFKPVAGLSVFKLCTLQSNHPRRAPRSAKKLIYVHFINIYCGHKFTMCTAVSRQDDRHHSDCRVKKPHCSISHGQSCSAFYHDSLFSSAGDFKFILITTSPTVFLYVVYTLVQCTVYNIIYILYSAPFYIELVVYNI